MLEYQMDLRQMGQFALDILQFEMAVLKSIATVVVLLALAEASAFAVD